MAAADPKNRRRMHVLFTVCGLWRLRPDICTLSLEIWDDHDGESGFSFFGYPTLQRKTLNNVKNCLFYTRTDIRNTCDEYGSSYFNRLIENGYNWLDPRYDSYSDIEFFRAYSKRDRCMFLNFNNDEKQKIESTVLRMTSEDVAQFFSNVHNHRGRDNHSKFEMEIAMVVARAENMRFRLSSETMQHMVERFYYFDYRYSLKELIDCFVAKYDPNILKENEFIAEQLVHHLIRNISEFKSYFPESQYAKSPTMLRYVLNKMDGIWYSNRRYCFGRFLKYFDHSLWGRRDVMMSRGMRMYRYMVLNEAPCVRKIWRDDVRFFYDSLFEFEEGKGYWKVDTGPIPDSRLFRFASERIRNDVSLFKAAIRLDGRNIFHAGETVKQNIPLLRSIVETSALRPIRGFVEFVVGVPAFKNDRKIVRMALGFSAFRIAEWMHKDLATDEDLACTAARGNVYAIKFFTPLMLTRRKKLKKLIRSLSAFNAAKLVEWSMFPINTWIDDVEMLVFFSEKTCRLLNTFLFRRMKDEIRRKVVRRIVV